MSSSPSSPELDKVQAMDTPSSSRNAEKLNNIDIVKRSDSEHDIKVLFVRLNKYPKLGKAGSCEIASRAL